MASSVFGTEVYRSIKQVEPHCSLVLDARAKPQGRVNLANKEANGIQEASG